MVIDGIMNKLSSEEIITVNSDKCKEWNAPQSHPFKLETPSKILWFILKRDTNEWVECSDIFNIIRNLVALQYKCSFKLRGGTTAAYKLANM